MKRLIALLLLLCFMFSFFGCSNSDKDNKNSSGAKIKHSVDVEKFASMGVIPEYENEVVLGDDAEAVKNMLFESAAGKTYDEFCKEILDNGGIIRDDIDMYSTFIQTVNSSDGRQAFVLASESEHKAVQYLLSGDKSKIAAIAIPGDLKAFGFKGVTKDYVKDCIAKKPKSFTPNSTFHFMPQSDDGSTGIYYEFGDYKLEFYFSSQLDLIMTVLYDKNLW